MSGYMFLLQGRVPGIELRGTRLLSRIPSPILYFIWRQGLTELLSTIVEAGFELMILLSQTPKLLGLQAGTTVPGSHLGKFT